MIKIKDHNLNKITIDEKSYKNFLFHCISYAVTNSVKPLYLIINEINVYIEEINKNKYFTLVPSGVSKYTL